MYYTNNMSSTVDGTKNVSLSFFAEGKPLLLDQSCTSCSL